MKRITLSSFLVVVALILQVTVLARLQLPGAVPDLLLLVVLGLALVYGHTAGSVIGFCAGLLVDFAPPADHAAGRYALVLCVIGYLAGLAKPEKGQLRSATGPMLVVVGAAIGATLLYAAVGTLVGDDAARHVGLSKLLFTAALYDLLLAPFIVPLVMALARRTEKHPLSDGGGTSSGGTRDRSPNWLTPGSGAGGSVGGWGKAAQLGKPSRFGKSIRLGKSVRIGSQRGGLLAKPVKSKTARIKGVKRL
ncbi:rod shape-determining protein MreD [Streptomyces zagrosensis]|uniref:Rod shape-determining protein MreD n=1 Tax=Streptomyces zagrosensis TaxID=1042984 RepID=A0A7W9Q765_9ACTN|nr:rod shape-determining protein MreD [Streptomyces zagrosensis]MBB5934886.1 rod shape-determining protein MreD [Streptomyces zagrosensis]